MGVVEKCMRCVLIEMNFVVKLIEYILLLKSWPMDALVVVLAAVMCYFYFQLFFHLSLESQQCRSRKSRRVSNCIIIIKTFAIVNPLTWHWLLATNSGTVYLYDTIHSTIYKECWCRMAMMVEQAPGATTAADWQQ